MEPRISLITLGVTDFQRALRFYRDGLGWRPSSVSTDDIAFFQIGGAVLSLWSRERLADDAGLSDVGSGFGGIALAHNVPTKEDVDAVMATAAAAGATIVQPAQTVFWGGYRGYFADPDGHPWEVAWNPGFPFAPDGSLVLPA